ncbi:dTDP-4-dehydrorhamnose reductase [Candidatus Peregrinibacteria bacterium]|nr:dTDP-4-dehydrorhamnose reductase [Candidatus Peregrinibacteria bacterium]
MLGSCFFTSLSGREDFEMYAFNKSDLDITDNVALKSVFEEVSPDFVVNCAGYTAVDDCENNQELAFKVNGLAPGEIAKLCKKENACLVHFSTDYVFDGDKKDGYEENDETSPINVYGESKLKGEKMIAENMKQYYIVRTSWLFGENGRNFVSTVIQLSKTNDELKIVGDQLGSPTYTKDLSGSVIKNFLSPLLSNLPVQHKHNLHEESDKINKKPPFGIYHLTNSEITSWFKFAEKIFQILNIDVKLKEITSDELPRPAKRPKYSILLNTKIKDSLRSWEKALEAYLKLNY